MVITRIAIVITLGVGHGRSCCVAGPLTRSVARSVSWRVRSVLSAPLRSACQNGVGARLVRREEGNLSTYLRQRGFEV